jgi:hypothetical protein
MRLFIPGSKLDAVTPPLQTENVYRTWSVRALASMARLEEH